jgi:hypothetical protein
MIVPRFEVLPRRAFTVQYSRGMAHLVLLFVREPLWCGDLSVNKPETCQRSKLLQVMLYIYIHIPSQKPGPGSGVGGELWLKGDGRVTLLGAPIVGRNSPLVGLRRWW